MKLRNLTLATTVILLPSPTYAQYFECEACPAGTWNNGNYDSCQKCATGTFAYVGSSSCTNCLTTGVASCSSTTGKATSCKSGFGFLFSGACSQCSAGTYSPGGTIGCYSCSSGYYSNAGASSCTKCPAGKYSSSIGSSSCTNCPAGTYSTGGASSCTSCLTTGVATCDSTTGKATSCVKGFNYDSQENVCTIDCQAQGFWNATSVGTTCQCEVIKTSDVITKIQNKNYKSFNECIEACSKSCGLSSERDSCYGSCHGYFSSQNQNAGYHYCCKTYKPSCTCTCPPSGGICGCRDTCESNYNEWRNGCSYTSNSCSGDHPIKVESL